MSENQLDQELETNAQSEIVNRALNKAVEDARTAFEAFKADISQEISLQKLPFEEALQLAQELTTQKDSQPTPETLKSVTHILKAHVENLKQKNKKAWEESYRWGAEVSHIDYGRSSRELRHLGVWPAINSKIRKRFLGVKRIASSYRFEQAEKQKEKVRNEYENPETGITKVERLASGLEFIQDLQYYNKAEEIIKKLAKIGNEYCDTVQNQTEIVKEVKELLVQETLAKLDKLSISYFSEEERPQLKVALDEYLAVRDKGDKETEQQKWAQLWTLGRSEYEFESKLEAIHKKYDKEIVNRLTGHLIRQKFNPILEEIKTFSSDNQQQKIQGILERYLQPRNWVVDRENLHHNLMPLTTKYITHRPGIGLDEFNLLKQSKTAQEIFGNEIKDLDHTFYQEILKESLTDDSDFIYALRYYPTPEAIKHLVMIAAADSSRYRLENANATLKELSSNEHWPQILTHAVEKIPELKDLKELLLNWSHGFNLGFSNINHPEIRQTAGNFALKIYHDDLEDVLLRKLAKEALPNKDLLKELVTEGKITDKTYQLYLAVEEKFQLYAEAFRKLPPEKQETQRDFDHNVWSYEYQVREIIKELSKVSPDGNESSDSLRKFETLSHFNQLLLESTNDPGRFLFLLKGTIVNTLTSDGKNALSSGHLDLLAQLYDANSIFQEGEHPMTYLPTIIDYPNVFLDKNNLTYLQTFHETYAKDGEYPQFDVVRKVLECIGEGQITKEYALALPKEAGELMDNSSFLIYLGTVFSDSEKLESRRKIFTIYGKDETSLNRILKALDNNTVTTEVSLVLPKLVPSLFSEIGEDMLDYVLEKGTLLLRNETDLIFLNKFIGRHGKTSLNLIQGYVECLEAGVVTPDQKELVFEFTQHFRVLKPNVLSGYIKAVENKTREMYLLELKSNAEKLVGSMPSLPETREKLYYRDLMEAIYPNNSGNNWTSYESNDSCLDRMQDIAQFTFKPKYEIDLLSSASVNLKEGATADEGAIESVKQEILGIASGMEKNAFDPDKTQQELVKDIDSQLELLQQEGALGTLKLEQLTTPEEKMFLLMTEVIYGSQKVSLDEIKKLLMRFEFAFFDDIRAYIQGTTDRVSGAPNKDYALMCELHSFFSDRVKEINRRLVRAGWANDNLRALMPEYFEKLSRQTQQTESSDQLNRLRLDRLGLSDSFITQIARTLKGRTGREYDKGKVLRIIRTFESMEKGLTASNSLVKKERTKAFYGQLKAQREKTSLAVEKITGESLDPTQFHLGDINLEELAGAQSSITAGEYNDEQFASYTTQRFLNIFSDEKNILDRELDKFESETGQARQLVNGYFTKNKESAHARMVGGVCVAGDNPTEEGRSNMWDQKNYFQFVLQDPETLRCQGLVLLHHFVDDEGRKVLTASLNPSSTYLYSVDARGLFNGLMKTLEEFASANKFDRILFSQNKTIRTNRTGGEFEKALDQRVSSVNQNYSFTEPQQFSYKPDYKIQEMDVVWQRS